MSMPDAKKKASAEIKAFKDRVRLEREVSGEQALRKIGEKVKARQPKKSET